MKRRHLLAAAAVGLGALAAYIWLAMWADERNQQLFIAREAIPRWARNG
jgi:hypothetical protein